jgi:hypothetical protein
MRMTFDNQLEIGRRCGSNLDTVWNQLAHRIGSYPFSFGSPKVESAVFAVQRSFPSNPTLKHLAAAAAQLHPALCLC